MGLDDITIPDSKRPNEDLKNNGFFVKSGKYFTVEIRGKNSTDIELSNFVMKIVYHLKNGTDDTQRIIFIKRHTGEKDFVVVFSSEMKPEAFETKLKSKSCTFLGTAYQLKRIFSSLMDNEQHANILQAIGWNNEFKVFAFADAVYSEDTIYKVDELGIVNTSKDRFYLPAFSYANLLNEDFKTLRLYKYSPGETDFKTWSELFYQAYGNNGIIQILFTILSIYRDVVFNQVGFFPFLFLFGDAGTGKTQSVEKLLRLFGSDVIGTSLNNATGAGLSRITAQKRNCLIYLKEYTNETEENIQDFILTAYDGAGRTIGLKTTDSRTKTFSVESGLVFDGNHLPNQKTAILMRMILLFFENNSFTDQQSKAFQKLKSLADRGFGNILIEILRMRDHIEENFRDTYISVKTHFRKLNLDQVPERMIEHISLIYAIWDLSKGFLKYPFDGIQLDSVLKENAESHNNLLKENSAVTVFWESFAHNVSTGQIHQYKPELNDRKTHFRVTSIQDHEAILQIRYKEIYQSYIKFCKDNAVKYLDKSSLLKILTSGSNRSFIKNHQKGRGSGYTDFVFGFCYQFRVKYNENSISINEVDVLL